MTTTDPAGRPAAEPPRTPRAHRRPTPQQLAVAEALEATREFLSAQELHVRLRSDGLGVGLATVYRTLQNLLEDNQIDVLRTADGEAVYRRCSTGHHHHLVCRRCRRTEEVDSAAVERWAHAVAAEHGFTEVDHVVEIFGVCSRCRAGDAGGDPA